MLSQPNIASVVHSSEHTIYFGSPTRWRLLYCCGLYMAKFSNGLLIFVCLPKAEVCVKNYRCHVQSLTWIPGYTVTKFADNCVPRTEAQYFHILLPKISWNKLSLFQGTSRIFVDMLKPFYQTTRRHTPGEIITLCTGVWNCNIRLCFNNFISASTHLT